MASIFGGNPATSVTPQASNPFASNNAATGTGSIPPAQGTQTSLFGSSRTQQSPAAQSSSLGPQPPANNSQPQERQAAQATRAAYFNSLLERGKKRPLTSALQSGNFDDVPTLQLGLDDIRRKARELGTAGNKDAQQSFAATKAYESFPKLLSIVRETVPNLAFIL